MDDNDEYKLGINDSRCDLDGIIFKHKGEDTKKRHFTSSRKHQCALLNLLLSKNERG